jgi:hypothetical protein
MYGGVPAAPSGSYGPSLRLSRARPKSATLAVERSPARSRFAGFDVGGQSPRADELQGDPASGDVEVLGDEDRSGSPFAERLLEPEVTEARAALRAARARAVGSGRLRAPAAGDGARLLVFDGAGRVGVGWSAAGSVSCSGAHPFSILVAPCAERGSRLR